MIHHVVRCGSTNDEAALLGRAGAAHGTAVLADEQEHGRGRLGRRWHSPAEDNLYLSVLLRPPLSPQKAPLLTLCAGVALADTATEELGERGECQLKWPNDLLARPLRGPGRAQPEGQPDGQAPLRKAGGILTEMVCAGGTVDFVVVGIGVNLNGQDFPEELRERATSLRACAGASQARAIDRLPFAERLIAALLRVQDLYVQEGAGPVLRRFTAHAPFLLQKGPIQVRSGTETIGGVPAGLAEDGALLLRDERGALHRVVAGEF